MFTDHCDNLTITLNFHKLIELKHGNFKYYFVSMTKELKMLYSYENLQLHD